MEKTTIRLDFTLESDSDGLPSASHLSSEVWDGLPDEWSEDEGEFRLLGIRFDKFEDKPEQGESYQSWRIAMLKAQLQERDKLVAHLETEISNLKGTNEALRDDVGDLVAGRNDADKHLTKKQEAINRLQLSLGAAAVHTANLTEKNDSQVNTINSLQAVIDAKNDVIKGQREELDNQLIEWTQMRDARDATRKLNSQQRIVMNETNAAVVRLKTDLRSCQKSNLNYIAERKVEEEMIAKIVDAMQGAGYDISGWGNDEQLTELEDAATQIENAGLKLSGKLDEIRTER